MIQPELQREVPSPSQPATAAEPARSAARVMLLASSAVTLALYWIPFGQWLARPLRLLSTLAHELGHGLTALLLGGRFQRLEMWASGAGLTEMDLNGFGRFRQAVTVAGGLLGPAVAAALCFTLGRTQRGARACLLGIGGLLVAAEILVVRNPFGLAFAGLVAAGCLLAAWRGTPTVAQVTVVFVAVQLALSVFSRADYLFVRAASNPTGSYPSDVLRLEQLLWLPHWIWGGLCGIFAIAVVGWGVRTFWRT